MINDSPSVKTSIAKRFILYIVLFSSFLTIFITAIQLYRDYNTDIALIHSELDQIESVHLNSLTSALWASNVTYLQTSLKGISKIRDVEYVEIRDEEKIWAKAGAVEGKDNIQRIYPMDYEHRNRMINIGSLTISVGLEGVYQRLMNKVWIILISNGIKTSLVAIFIYFLFYRLVGRHLSAISVFSEKHEILTGDVKLSLDRNSKAHDEFDAVVTSINNMHERLNQQVLEIDQQKKYLSLTLNSIGDAVITTDENGNVTRLNPVAEQLTGWESREAINQSLKTIFPIVDASTREPIENPVDKVLSTGETVYLSNHTTLISKSGKEYQIADSAAPIVANETFGGNDFSGKKILGMVLVFNDVTEQYRLRQALIESEKKLRLIYTQIPGVVYQFKIDSQGERSFLYVSPAVQDCMGVSVESVMKSADSVFSLTHPEDYPSLLESIVISLTHLTVWSWEGRFIKSDGKVIYLRGTASPERIADGSTVWNGLFIDITEGKLKEEQLRRSQKMEALGKLTGGIAHDYNNILGIVVGYAEQIKQYSNDAEKVTKYSEVILKSAERGSVLAKKLLSFSQTKQPIVTVTDINRVLKENEHLLEQTLTANHKLTLRLADELWLVDLDSGDLEDAIINMGINALHAMKSGGQLTINTSNETLNEQDVKQLSISKGDYVLLSVTDTGCGMPSEVRERIFDPFYSTKGEQGTGLGLSQVYGFVDRSAGAISVYSEEGRGSRFVIYFPRSKETVVDEVPERISSAPLENSGGSETLLIVDDEQAMVDLAYDIFTAKGYRVLTANDGEKALTLLKNKMQGQPKVNVDLIISDVIMPNMDGYEFAAQVRQLYPQIKIQMVSGFSDERHEGMVDQDLHLNLLHKPYASNTLLKRVRDLLEHNERGIIEKVKETKGKLLNLTVLTLDDEEDIQSLYQIYLKKLGCRVITVFTAQEAIDTYEKALNTDQSIDIMIVDLSMPGDMSGNEVTEKIRAIHPSAKVIVASGHSEGLEMKRPQEYGFDSALEKNFSVDNMRRVLEGVLE